MSSSIKILPGATVVEDCTLVGDITIGGGTVVHPRASIIAEGGPIIIAEYCIIEEYATILHKKRECSEEDANKPLFIGAHTVLEVGARLEQVAGHVGESNVLECKCVVGEKVKIGSGCVIGARCVLMSEMNLGDNTVVWGEEQQTREALDKQPSQLLQLDFLSKVMPNYHRLRKPNLHKRKHDPPAQS